MTEVINLPVDEIKPQTIERPYDPAKLEELKCSISSVGILQPLIVAKQNDKYFLVVGRRRLAAARALGMPHVPCILMESDKSLTATATLHENMFREELNPVDEAQVYSYLTNQEHMSQRDISKMANKSESYISQRLSLLLWHPDLVEALRTSAIGFSVARELALFRDEKSMKHHLHYAKAQGANYRTARSWRLREAAERSSDEITPNDAGATIPSTQVFRPFGQCFWCGEDVDADKLITVHLCMDDYQAMMSNKEAAANAPKKT